MKDARVHCAGRGEGLLSEIRNIVDGRVAVKGGGSWDLSAERSDRSEATVNLLVHQYLLDGPPLPCRFRSCREAGPDAAIGGDG